MFEPLEDAPVDFDPIIPTFREWALLKSKSVSLTMQLNRLRDRISSAVEERGYKDQKGSQYIDLPFPILTEDGEYNRIKRERRVSIIADPDAAERITRAKGEEIWARAFPPVPTLDCDELYVLLQEGILDEKEMDEILLQKESFAFKGLFS